MGTPISNWRLGVGVLDLAVVGMSGLGPRRVIAAEPSAPNRRQQS
jgi:hypothetical protein